MSLFGKILALLNLLGVAGLGALVALDYAKRKSWAYSVFLHERAVHGLPLDEDDTDAEGRRLVDKLSPKLLNDLFAQAGGSPVSTQVAEVKRVKDRLDSKVAAAGSDNAKQIVAPSRILAPLADGPRERERFLANFTHFSDAEALKRLQGRFRAAFVAAGRPPEADAPPQPFEKSFREALRAQTALEGYTALQAGKKEGGESAEALTVAFLRALPEDAKVLPVKDPKELEKLADDTFAKALQEQSKELQGRYHAAFAEALEGKRPDQAFTEGREVSTRDQRRLAIARLLFALLPVLAEDDLS